MRDILITLIVLGSLPFIFKSPAIGGLMWVWISVMNPHTQGWGFATQFPFAFVIAIVTVTSLLLTRQPKSLPINPVSMTLLAFVLWMNVTTLFAIFPAGSFEQWNKVMKIMFMTFVTLMVIRQKKDVHRLLWILVISLGYYGVKGGIFTIRSGGSEKVWGPEGSFIGDNNSIALALIMAIPMMHYVQQASPNKWVRHGLTGMMLLSALAAMGSYSRGAVLAIVAMVIFMWFKSSKKMAIGSMIIMAAPLFLAFMPTLWFSRMDTISDYQIDGSAQGRINAWQMAFNLAKDRFFGGGFEIYEPSVFAMYAPNPEDVHAAHSIYFQVLGEHGFIGLGLYLMLGIYTWRCGSWIIRHTEKNAALSWACSLTTMIQTSLIGFAVGGAFLSLLYFDVPYYLMVALISTRILVERELHTTAIEKIATSSQRKHPGSGVLKT